eukprot:1224766-Prymnesium_polylepis.1
MMSAKMTTENKFAFKYGVLDLKFTLPRGDYFWPAFWLLPEESPYGRWPATGEIDVIESYGNKPSSASPQNYNTIGTTLHYGMPTMAPYPPTPSPPPVYDAWPASHCDFENASSYSTPGVRHEMTM